MTGTELKEARLEKKLTQRKLGEMLGFRDRGGENTVQNWEYGKQPIPSKYWRKLSEILDIPLDKFIP